MTERILDDLVDDFCYEVALAMRRLLDVEEAGSEYGEEIAED